METSQNVQNADQAVDTLQLGGNIDLTGFRGLEPGSMVILKKIVGNYARKFSEICAKFEKISFTLKPVHETEGSKKYEVHGKLMDNGSIITSEITDRNLFMALDIVCKKIEASIKK
jgi:ribosome-associated translation inhibitor RaiA